MTRQDAVRELLRLARNACDADRATLEDVIAWIAGGDDEPPARKGGSAERMRRKREKEALAKASQPPSQDASQGVTNVRHIASQQASQGPSHVTLPVARVSESEFTHSDSDALSGPSEPLSGQSLQNSTERTRVTTTVTPVTTAPVTSCVTCDEDDGERHEPYQPPEDNVFRRRHAAVLGAIAWLQAVTGVAWPQREWAREWATIAEKPVAERRAVALALKASEWARANPTQVTPGHVVKHWPKYASGQSDPVPVSREARADQQADIRERARLEQEREMQEKMRREMRGEYSPPPAAIASLLPKVGAQ